MLGAFLMVMFLVDTLNLGFPGPPSQDSVMFMTCTLHLMSSNTECEYKVIKPIINTLRFINLKTSYGII